MPLSSRGDGAQRRMVEASELHAAHPDVYVSRAVGHARQGWRSRLAHIEMLLSDGQDRNEQTLRELVGAALSEVRSMIDGD